MKKLLNIMRREAMAEDGRALPVIGLVSSYDPENYCAKVLIQPEGVETGWLPVAAEWVGNGWGMFCPPSIDDMVLVEFIGGDLEAGVITKRLYNDSDRPQAVPIGEFWLLHKAGASVKLTNDGKATVSDKAGSMVVLNGDGTGSATFSGALTIKAAVIKLQNAGTALLSLLNSAFATWAANHVHSNGNGGANTGAPTTAPGAGTQTSIVQAE